MTSNVHPHEIEKFGALASRWWDPNGPQRPLHELNPVRLDYVARWQPLAGAKVLDVGCGGGLLTEAMALRQAQATGIDLSTQLIDVARLHLLESGVKAEYRVIAVEDLANLEPGQFDAITCMEMLEHVPDPHAILKACHTLLKPGGRLLLSTLNRTPAAFALAIVGAEYAARLLPKGTHDYRSFIKPSELAASLRSLGFSLLDISGLRYNPLSRKAAITANATVNYLMCAEKPND
ncbi:MAG TPA: bifunctional 2-polyprenyl-6-hydroxyphenol methylase/3-demethylubiquinol 3-O-methyltransferase UbiG [Arenimonas sp.]|nr:bifunctional 2-polyprenyl-6-hydroxyphenol methylase/3-demethylubiquinol 3-O-methyltransferase UbiG [Arenimonas sp.]